jgi:aspartate/methionine/tyrosine aminotransferase
MREAFDRRRRLMHQLLSDIPGVRCPLPEGAFYAYPSLADVVGKTIRGKTPTTSSELCQVILEEVGVAIVPGEAFGTPGYARLSYALGDGDLAEGVRRIGALLGEAS